MQTSNSTSNQQELVNQTNQFMFKVFRTLLITIILFMCFMGRSQTNAPLVIDNVTGEFIDENSNNQFFYALVRERLSEVKWDHLTKSKDERNVYEIKDEAYESYNKLPKKIIFVESFNDLKKAREYKMSNPQSKYRIVKVDSNRLKTLRSSIKQSTNDMRSNYYDGMYRTYQYRNY